MLKNHRNSNVLNLLITLIYDNNFEGDNTLSRCIEKFLMFWLGLNCRLYIIYCSQTLSNSAESLKENKIHPGVNFT